MKIYKEELAKIVRLKCANTSCGTCPYDDIENCKVALAAEFLEHHPELIQNEPTFQVPIKTTWSLKKEYLPLYKSITGHDPQSTMSDVANEIKPFYDCTETPDYSQVPIGAVVKIECADHFYYGVVKENDRNKIYIGYTLCADVIDRSKNNLFFNYSTIKSLTIHARPEAAK